MIVYPKEWVKVGQKVQLLQIEEALLDVLIKINCNCLSYSGGIDSTIILFLMLKIYKGGINTFTIGASEDHPDIKISKLVVEQFKNINHYIIIPTQEEIENETYKNDFKGDSAVRFFYKEIKKYNVNKIIACDGIDEFMCGYYDHINSPGEKIYYDYLGRLQEEQLIPLNKNSGDIEVYLPYIDNKLISLYSQISLFDKTEGQCRKKIMIELAKKLCIPEEVINRRKYGFCDALEIKE